MEAADNSEKNIKEMSESQNCLKTFALQPKQATLDFCRQRSSVVYWYGQWPGQKWKSSPGPDGSNDVIW